ncbi:MAG: LutB/LldF family L-lactate oxidation iron-sulfur protein [Actinomycetota bacterium]
MSPEPLTLTTSLRERTAAQVSDSRLRSNLARATDAFAERKDSAYAQFADPDDVRARARAAKANVLRRLDEILGLLADRLEAAGAHVHWARTDEEARDHVRRIVESHSVERIVKSKSMLSEEIALNDALEEIGVEVTETDLGEWIIQIAREAPSHIIVPAIHKDRAQVRDTLQRVAEGDLSDVPGELAAFARRELRQRFLQADLGISGVNFAVAESGTLVLVTNEGNGRLTTSVPPIHVAMLGMERVVETWRQLDLLLALLPRAATGQPITTYVSGITGARRPGELDGPQELHVVVVDNGRSSILGTEFTEMLACIRCGACLNVCPVYRQTGGHAYGWVYPGPMGAVLTPLLVQSEGAAEVPNASSLCGACWQACPVGIPLQDMLLSLRRRASEDSRLGQRAAWGAWAAAWSRPWAYRASLRIASMAARMFNPARIPGPPQRWALGREAPTPARSSFRDRWRKGSR